jgi:hypothetical protein
MKQEGEDTDGSEVGNVFADALSGGGSDIENALKVGQG